MNFLEDCVIFILMMAFVAGIFTGVFHLAEASVHDNCHDKGKLAQVQVTYRKWDGCYVNSNGLWMPIDKWQYNREHNIKNP